MTQPDRFFPGDAANAGSFAEFAAKTQADWEAGQRNSVLARFSGAERGFSGLLNLVSFIPFIGPQIAQALLGQESTVDDLRGWSTILHRFLPVLGTDPDAFDLGAAARDFITGVLNLADGGLFNLDLIPNLGQDKLDIPNVQQIVDNIVQGGGGTGVGNAVDAVLERVGGIFETATRADQNAIAIQASIQEIIADDQSGGGAGGVSFNVVFQGADGATLPGFTVGPAPGDIVIRSGNVAGLRSDAGNGEYWAAFDETYTTDDQSVSGVFGAKGSFEIFPTLLLARSDATLTNGAWIGATRDELLMGSYTRSGSVFTLNTMASITVGISIGSRMEMRCLGTNYFGLINDVALLSFTDTGGAITVGSTNRTPGFVLARDTPLLSAEYSFWLAAFAMADISSSTGGTNVPSWHLSRANTTTVLSLSAINGNVATLPDGFFTAQTFATDVTVTDIAHGVITIIDDGWYEIDAALMARPSGTSIDGWYAPCWALFKNGAQFSGPTPMGVSKKVFLISGDTVQMGVCGVGATPTSTEDIGADAGGALINVGAVKGYASFAGRLIQAA